MAISGLVLVPETATATTNTASIGTGPQGIIPMVTAGSDHTCALLSTGNIICWGSDDFGQLGNGPGNDDIETPPKPITLPDGATATAITAGLFHTCALLNDGNITCWGNDDEEQLGNGTTTGNIDTPPDPITLPDGATATAITAGKYHTCALLNDGNITCWGDDSSGQLGNDDTTGNIDTPPKPITLPVGATATAITAGTFHTCALLNDGNITCWGDDGNGQLGNGDTITDNILAPPARITLPNSATATAITAGYGHTCALLNDGNITCWGDYRNGQLGNGATTGFIHTPPDPIGLPGSATATAIAAGKYHTCALLNDGNITCWGDDRVGQLGNGTITGDIDTPPDPITLPVGATATAIAAGYGHTCALLNDGNITCWGDDFVGQLGNGATITGDIVAPPAPITLPSTGTAAAITTGYAHTCALLNNGNITCWGSNGNGQLGNGTIEGNIHTPPEPITLPGNATATAITAGYYHTCALLNTGNITCWGSNGNGQLGNGTIEGNIDAPPDPIGLPDGATATAITAGKYHTCALLNDGNITCWGDDSSGQLGNDDITGDIGAPPARITLPVGATATAITAGDYHTCALLNDGNITCWGDDRNGQLGNGDTITDNILAPPDPIGLRNGATATAITAGGFHTCALLNDGNITCWGFDGKGQLGNGAITGFIHTPPDPIGLPDGATATAITTGYTHTCALLNTGNITCWGWGNRGQLGNGGTGDIGAPPTPITLPVGATATAITAGPFHTCALLNDGNITCWGDDGNGQLGNGAITGNILAPPDPIGLPDGATTTAITAGATHTCALLNDGNITCWGNDNYGQLGNGPGNDDIDTPPTIITLPDSATATAITAGLHHTCALLNTGNITCWGDNGDGQLGNGATITDPIEAPPARITLRNGATATAITAGYAHTCALLNDGNITCWGTDSSGQLGNGPGTEDILAPPDPITLRNGATATAITAGAFHTCALLNDGNITCWGNDSSGQLGNGPGTEDIDTPPDPITLPDSATATAITAGSHHTCALLNTGNITCWGNDGDGQLGNGPGTDNILAPPAARITLPNSATATAITAGYNHTCALLNDGNITCWGSDSHGQLGNGPGNDLIDTPTTTITLPDGATATAITAGLHHTCALLNNGTSTCWGDDLPGQLGNGTTAGNIDTPSGVVGVPTVSVVAGTTPTNGVVEFTATFNQTVLWFDDPLTDVEVTTTTGGTATITPTSQTGTYTIAVKGMTSDGTIAVAIPAGAANSTVFGLANTAAPTAATITYDTTGPVATVKLAAGQAATASAGPVKFAVTFNESVTGFTTDDITITGTAGATAGTITGSGAVYTVTVSTIPNNGTIVLTVATGAVSDTNANGSTTTVTANTVTVAPTVPGTPTAPAAVAGDASATVTWTAPAATGGSAIIGYRIQKSTNSGATWVNAIASTGNSATTAVITGLVNSTGVRFRISAINTVGTSTPSAATATVTPVAVTPPTVTPVEPGRLYESRSGASDKTFDGAQQGVGRTLAGKTATINITGRAGVPNNATAVFLNVVAANPSRPGYLTVFPCGTKQPLASNVNYNGNDISFNAVLAKIGTNGNVCVYTSADTDLIIDVNGYVPASGSPNPISPARLYESRSGASDKTFDGAQQGVGRTLAGKFATINITGRAGVPNNATAVFLNVVAANPSRPGYLTVFPCGTKQPLASNVNYNGNDISFNAVLAKIGTNGNVCVYTSADTDLIIDVNGYVPASGSPNPISPARLYESRSGASDKTFDAAQQGVGRTLAGKFATINITGRAGVPNNATAVFLNVVAANPSRPGYLTVFPCGTKQPLASNVNYKGNDISFNAVLAKIGTNGNVCVYTSADTDLIIDINGYIPGN